MKQGKLKKKIGSLLLTAVMIAASLPAFSAEVRAAGLPDTSQFVTKDQLKTFNTNDQDGTTDSAKVYFGNKSQKWWIAGSQSDESLVLFAASPLLADKVFEGSGRTDKTYSEEWDCDYTSTGGSNPTYVYPNHYGASPLRMALRDCEFFYFTIAEQNLMNDTTIYTNDTKNSSVYSTKEKLYLAYGDYSSANKDYITVGANGSDNLNNGLRIDKSYWGDSGNFWLRAPYATDSYFALLACPDKSVNRCNVDANCALVPAFELNLSSVLFASAAPAASAGGTTTPNEFTLRYQSTGNETATINAAGSGVAITGASDNMYLVVQNSTGAYAKALTAATTFVSADDIAGITDFNNCKVWLESTDTAKRITTAKLAAQEVAEISSVAITDITAPTAGSDFDTTAACATTGVSTKAPTVTWTPGESPAGYNKVYTASVTLTPADNYAFTDTTTATVNGNPATSITKNDDGTVTVTYTFAATAKDKLISITVPIDMTVANGTTYDAMNLPTDVAIVTEGRTVTTASVNWNTTTPASGSYEPAVLTEQKVTLKGSVTCPGGIDQNNVELTTTITITISAAGIAEAPSFNPAAGTYTENQSVTLSSTTADAIIYYTTDGTEPTTASTKYSTPISVTGVAGERKETTIKAIAVKDGMQASSVASAVYVINIPAPPAPTLTYKIIGGANGTWTANSNETLTIRGDGPVSKFKEVKVDGDVIEKSNYTVAEGSTIITLKADYLKTLAVGKHSVEFVWTDGSATTSFTVKAATPAKPSQKKDVPRTGDNTLLAWLAILVILSGNGIIYFGRKKKSVR